MFILAIPNFSNFFEYYTVHSNMKAKGHHIRRKPLVPNKSVFGKQHQLSFAHQKTKSTTNYDNKKNIEEIGHFLRFNMFVYHSLISYIDFGIFCHKKRRRIIAFKQ